MVPILITMLLSQLFYMCATSLVYFVGPARATYDDAASAQYVAAYMAKWHRQHRRRKKPV